MSLSWRADELLKAHGMRVTPQRRHILTVFLEDTGIHRSADEVRERILPVLPELARGTTYNTLRELVRQGILEEIPSPEGLMLYGLRLVPHHHFVCDRCHRYFDVPWDTVPVPAFPLPPDIGQVNGVTLVAHGLCAACQKGQA
ncbi:MAG: Fur family transcriptional regulator [Sulfobacillus sp.]|nr:Fur family transcriptional regulator [Sulfobacillus sp.]